MSNFDPAWVRSEATYRADQIRAGLVGPGSTGIRGRIGRLGMRRLGRRTAEGERLWS
jgi:hypothetical protein